MDAAKGPVFGPIHRALDDFNRIIYGVRDWLAKGLSAAIRWALRTAFNWDTSPRHIKLGTG